MKTTKNPNFLKKFLPLCAAVAAAAACLIPATMNAAVFAKYDGVDGESTQPNRDKWIDVLSIDWGAHRTIGPIGSTRTRGNVTVRDFRLTLKYGKASPKLAEKCLKGEVIPKLEIEFTKMIGGSPVTYLKYELKNVLVTNFDVNASGNDESPPTVTIANNFEELKVTYTEFDSSGGAAGNVEYEYRVDQPDA